MSSDVAYPNDSIPIIEHNGKKYHFCVMCGKNIPVTKYMIKPNGSYARCVDCWEKQNSPSEFGRLGMTELLLKSFLPTYEDVDIDGFEWNLDNHLDQWGAPARAQTTTIKFKLKNGKWVRMTIE